MSKRAEQVNEGSMALLSWDPAAYGGRGGDSFDDSQENENIVSIRTVKIRSGDQVDSIQVRPPRGKTILSYT